MTGAPKHVEEGLKIEILPCFYVKNVRVRKFVLILILTTCAM